MEARLGVAQDVVQRISGPAFAVDQNLSVVAWNRKAEEGLRLSASEAMGRPCYEVVPAVDIESGRPCHETCPLVHGAPRYGWAYNRVLRASWAGGRRTRLDCFLLRCLLPSFEQSNVCFVGPPTASTIQAHSRVLEALETIYPVVSGPTDPREAFSVIMRTLLRATSADAGEMFLLDPATRELVPMEQQGLPTTAVREFCRSAIGEEFPSLLAHSEVPLLAVGAPPGEKLADGIAWYVCAPLIADERILGILAIASQRHDFDLASAVRILFPVAVQVSVYLRWAYLVDDTKEKASAVQASPRLRLYCLGPFRAVLDGKPLPPERFERFKAVTLLKLLAASRGRPVAREALMEFLWPEADPAYASGNLRVVLHALRRGLEPQGRERPPSSFVLSQGDLVYLDPSEAVWVDAEEFVAGATRAAELARAGREEDALAECRRAASLYKGPYLEDEPYSDWCLFERERLKERYIGLLKLMASILARRGDLVSAIDTYRTALGVDQGREEIHRELIQILWQAGRRDEALRQYQTCATVLQAELGTEPTKETRALYQAVLVGSSGIRS